MRAGTFDRRVRFEKRSTVQDPDFGTVTPTWAPVVGLEEVWVSIQDTLPSKAEVIAQGVEQSYQPSRVRMQWTEIAINATMRIVDLDRNDRIMDVVTEAAEYGRREALEFMVNRFTQRGDA